MQLEDRLSAFLNLGKRLESIDNVTLSTLTEKTKSENSWFTDNNVVMALTGVRRLLEARALETWVSGYNIPPLKSPSEVALILAGNIPCVGFHDILCVLITGNRAQIKRSSKDSVLITFILDSLVKIDYRFEEYISFTEKVKNFDAVIATGSDNSSRYFDYYFSKYPSIIRKNRTSVAIMSGTESVEDIQQLGVDIFSYFGLGCRNVSKIFVPEKYSIPMLFDHWKKFEPVICHHKYANNY
ncbi:MAG TPA: acyl-CoA reductase, partial [Cyclobacteriaceae bacterium]|nr:acyl-CoA reductase [Cyclobacteriaceae bacterium]